MTEEQAKNLKPGTRVLVLPINEGAPTREGAVVTSMNDIEEIALEFDDTFGPKWIHYSRLSFVGDAVERPLPKGAVCDCGGSSTYGPNTGNPIYHSRWCSAMRGVRE